MLPSEVDMHYVRESYSQSSTVGRYDDAFHSITTSTAERTLYARYLPFQGHILDVGCGVGRGSRVLQELGFSQVTGVDVSSPMVNLATTHFAGISGFRFIVMDLVKERLTIDHYDGAIAQHGIMPIPTYSGRVAALQNVYVSLRRGGHLVMASFLRTREFGNTDADFADGDSLINTPLAAQGSLPVYIHIPDRREIEEAFRATGFTIVEMVPFDSFEDTATVHSSQRCMYTIGRKPA
jgi:SAM-dependent methyltransferase